KAGLLDPGGLLGIRVGREPLRVAPKGTAPSSAAADLAVLAQLFEEPGSLLSIEVRDGAYLCVRQPALAVQNAAPQGAEHADFHRLPVEASVARVMLRLGEAPIPLPQGFHGHSFGGMMPRRGGVYERVALPA